MRSSMKRCFALICMLLLSVIDPGCSDESECPVCPADKIKTVFIDDEFGTYYLLLVSGDREFGSYNGPRVFFDAFAYLKGEDSLMCFVSMTAVEDPAGSICTVGQVGVDVCVYVAPSGWKITDVGAKPCTIDYRDPYHNWHEVGCESWIFYYVGDTIGNDICSPPSDCARFRFRFISTVEIQKMLWSSTLRRR